MQVKKLILESVELQSGVKIWLVGFDILASLCYLNSHKHNSQIAIVVKITPKLKLEVLGDQS